MTDVDKRRGRRWCWLAAIGVAAGAVVSCGRAAGPPDGGGTRLAIGVAFETLQTEFWVAAWNGLRSETAKRRITMLEAVADGDPNKQLEQVRTFINRRV